MNWVNPHQVPSAYYGDATYDYLYTRDARTIDDAYDLLDCGQQACCDFEMELSADAMDIIMNGRPTYEHKTVDYPQYGQFIPSAHTLMLREQLAYAEAYGDGVPF